jgi:hypothetical protein
MADFTMGGEFEVDSVTLTTYTVVKNQDMIRVPEVNTISGLYDRICSCHFISLNDTAVHLGQVNSETGIFQPVINDLNMIGIFNSDSCFVLNI